MFFFIARQARSADAATRARAAQKLGGGGRATGGGAVSRQVALLLELAKDEDARVRVAAFESLGRTATSGAIEGMTAALKEVDKLQEPHATAARDAAARAFEGMGADATAALVQLTRDKSTKAREVAVMALGGIGGPDAERALSAALQDQRSSVRQLAVQALARSASAGSIGSLRAALEHRDPATRRSAIEAVAGIRGAEAGQALVRSTRDTDRGVREAAVSALARQASPEAIDGLLGVFEGPDREMRQLAATALKGLEWQPVTASQRALRAILQGNYAGAAAEGEAGVEPLAALLTDKSPAVRRSVTEALGRTAHASAIRPLLLSLQDNDAGVRQAACDALVRIGAPAVAPLACAVHEAVRTSAPDIVTRIGGPAAAPLIDLLERGEPFRNDAAEVSRVSDDEEAEQAERAAHLLHRLLGQSVQALDVQALGRARRLRDIVRVREIMPTSRRESARTVVDTVVDCQELRERAAGELERRK